MSEPFPVSQWNNSLNNLRKKNLTNQNVSKGVLFRKQKQKLVWKDSSLSQHSSWHSAFLLLWNLLKLSREGGIWLWPFAVSKTRSLVILDSGFDPSRLTESCGWSPFSVPTVNSAFFWWGKEKKLFAQYPGLCMLCIFLSSSFPYPMSRARETCSNYQSPFPGKQDQMTVKSLTSDRVGWIHILDPPVTRYSQ